MGKAFTPEKFLARFFERLGPPNARGCREWTGAHCKKGYGHVWRAGRFRRATHVALELHDGQPVHPHTVVMHTCDNPPCCSGAHLVRGSHVANVADMVAKGRQARGNTSGAFRHPESTPRGDTHWTRTHPDRVPKGEVRANAKLNPAKVVEIRARAADGESQDSIARAIGISQWTVSHIVRRLVWKHVA